ncbi:DUF6398 domain-containing protein [Thermodesulfobacteriota bacterium]
MDERIANKKQRLEEIKELVLAFCEEHLNEELAGYALKLCEKLTGKRKISITRGQKEIWAAAIVYVIARLNFLFDMENEFFISADTICDFFGTKKSTVGNKATQIEKVCNLGLGAEGFCSPDITDALTLVELSNGLVVPKNMLPDFDIVHELAEEEETKEIEQFMDEQRRLKERQAAEKKARRAEINRKIAEEKKKRKIENDKQLSLFDDFSS